MNEARRMQPYYSALVAREAAKYRTVARSSNPQPRKNGNIKFEMGGSLYQLPPYSGSNPAGSPAGFNRYDR
jgi:hypothetical protein